LHPGNEVFLGVLRYRLRGYQLCGEQPLRPACQMDFKFSHFMKAYEPLEGKAPVVMHRNLPLPFGDSDYTVVHIVSLKYFLA
jgi:hypothetical protein